MRGQGREGEEGGEAGENLHLEYLCICVRPFTVIKNFTFIFGNRMDSFINYLLVEYIRLSMLLMKSPAISQFEH